MTALLSISDINTAINHEPRMLDVRLAEALGFSQAYDIRKLINRHKKALESFAELVLATVAKTPKGGRPGKEYWLTKKQALYLCTKSETPNATEVTIQMVEVFDQATEGKPVYVRAHARAMPRKPRPTVEQAAASIPAEDLLTTTEGNLREVAKKYPKDRQLHFSVACLSRFEHEMNEFGLHCIYRRMAK